MEGDFNNSNDQLQINTTGISDHSGTHFDPNGNEISSTGKHYAVLGIYTTQTPNQISTSFKAYKNRTYTLYFRYATNLNSDQKITANLLLNQKLIATSKMLTCSDQHWKTCMVQFKPSHNGNVTLNFNNDGSTNSRDSDTLLDSVMVTSTPSHE